MGEADAGAVVMSGRCYCGASVVRAHAAPRTVAYCHCASCRRVSGAPVSAIAAFDEAALTIEGTALRSVSVTPGVRRTFCSQCGSPLAGRYAYLPGQVFVPVGVLDQAEDLAPELHAHEGERLAWLHLNDDAERFVATSRSRLNAAPS